MPSKRELDISRTVQPANGSPQVEDAELQVEIENVQRAMSDLKPKLDEAEKRLAGHSKKFDFVRQLIIIDLHPYLPGINVNTDNIAILQ